MGPAGSGKSTKAKKLAAECCICEADQYWLNCVGEYLFIPSKIGDAHKWCQNKVETLMKEGKSRIVVSNTSLNKKERQVYRDIATRHDYDVEVELPDSPWFLDVYPRLLDKTFTNEDVKIFAEKCIHNVPLDVMQRMFLKYEED